jgi:hypothetical protein
VSVLPPAAGELGAGSGWLELVTIAREPERLIAELRVAGRAVGRAVYGAWPEVLAIYALEVTPDHLDAAIALFAGVCAAPGGPASLYHVDVQDPAVLRAWRRTPLARGLVVVGSLGGVLRYHERLVDLPAEAVDAEADPEKPTALVVAWSPGLEVLDRLATLDDAARIALLRAPTASGRIGALRGIGRDAQLPRAARDDLHLFALLDPSFEVRRFASLQMSGYLDGVLDLPDLELVHRHLDEPLLSLSTFGEPAPVPEGTPYAPARGRRNKRFALLWVVGGMFGFARDTPEVEAWRAEQGPALWARLEDEAGAHTRRRDRELLAAAVEDLAGPTGDRIGEMPRLNLFELCRYVVMRHRLAQRMDGAEAERFAWLADMVSRVYPSPRAPVGGARFVADARAVAAALYGPRPGPVSLPRALPARLRGRTG